MCFLDVLSDRMMNSQAPLDWQNRPIKRRLHDYGQSAQAAKDEAGQPGQHIGLAGKAQARETAQQGIEGDLGLKATKGRAQAVVDAVTKGDLFACRALQVEPVGVRKLLRVAIGRAQA